MTHSSPLFEKPSGVIFDLDGTLLDTEPLYTQASQKVMDPFGKTFDMSLKKRTMGRDARVSAQVTIDHLSLPLNVDEYLSQREEYLRQLFPSAEEIEGAGEFIERLHAKGICQGIATSSHQHLSDLKLAPRRWKSMISVIICGDNPALTKAKPEPDIFLLCAQQLNVSPQDCIAFEDSPNGIASAKAAGMEVIAINSPWVENSDLAGASLIIDDFHQMNSLIENW